jgi:hypothetical protein
MPMETPKTCGNCGDKYPTKYGTDGWFWCRLLDCFPVRSCDEPPSDCPKQAKEANNEPRYMEGRILSSPS